MWGGASSHWVPAPPGPAHLPLDLRRLGPRRWLRCACGAALLRVRSPPPASCPRLLPPAGKGIADWILLSPEPCPAAGAGVEPGASEPQAGESFAETPPASCLGLCTQRRHWSLPWSGVAPTCGARPKDLQSSPSPASIPTLGRDFEGGVGPSGGVRARSRVVLPAHRPELHSALPLWPWSAPHRGQTNSARLPPSVDTQPQEHLRMAHKAEVRAQLCTAAACSSRPLGPELLSSRHSCLHATRSAVTAPVAASRAFAGAPQDRRRGGGRPSPAPLVKLAPGEAGPGPVLYRAGPQVLTVASPEF